MVAVVWRAETTGVQPQVEERQRDAESDCDERPRAALGESQSNHYECEHGDNRWRVDHTEHGCGPAEQACRSARPGDRRQQTDAEQDCGHRLAVERSDGRREHRSEDEDKEKRSDQRARHLAAQEQPDCEETETEHDAVRSVGEPCLLPEQAADDIEWHREQGSHERVPLVWYVSVEQRSRSDVTCQAVASRITPDRRAEAASRQRSMPNRATTASSRA